MSAFSRQNGPVSTEKWYALYQSAVLEVDDVQLAQRILEARRAIFDRAEEVLTVSLTDERRDLNDALHVLSVLEKTLTKQSPSPELSPHNELPTGTLPSVERGSPEIVNLHVDSRIHKKS